MKMVMTCGSLLLEDNWAVESTKSTKCMIESSGIGVGRIWHCMKQKHIMTTYMNRHRDLSAILATLRELHKCMLPLH